MNDRKSEYPLEVAQHRVVERITFKKLIRDIGQALNLERGMFFAVKMLIADPGTAVSSFLYEKRFSFFHPVRMLILTSAVSLFSFWLIDGAESMSDAFQVNTPEVKEAEAFNKMAQDLFAEAFNDYFNVMIWMFIPIISFFSYLFFGKSGYNYAEHLVLNAYITSIGNLINTVFYTLALVIDIGISSLIAISFYLIYNLYAYKSFFKLTLGRTLIKGMLCLILGYFVYMIVLTVLIAVRIGYKMAEMGLFSQ